VIDAATGDDITRLILTQIIVEDAKTPQSNFPLDLLRQMVVASGRATQESALNYMKAMLDLYQSSYRAVAPQLNPFDFMQSMQSNRGAPANEPVPPASERPTESTKSDASPVDSEEVTELKARLAELEKMVSKLVPGKPKKK
ncbi:MAG: polyhydroxyalkanoate synthesis regulator DNA-binding domain-containing protein, partial [Acidobacteriaceae bacterium]